ncbi:unnamed protein product, partial [Nesidiocoris tenuis]
MDFIERLKDPYLVLSIQKYFGVLPKVKTGRFVDKTHPAANGNTPPGAVSSSEDDELQYTSGSDSEDKEYAITNKFWYFLFVLGTELGDEIFYASFIPFWFWNIDGAVGRRVVMVWSIVMCV